MSFDRCERFEKKKVLIVLCRYHIGRHAANLQVANTYEGTNVSDFMAADHERYTKISLLCRTFMVRYGLLTRLIVEATNVPPIGYSQLLFSARQLLACRLLPTKSGIDLKKKIDIQCNCYALCSICSKPLDLLFLP